MKRLWITVILVLASCSTEQEPKTTLPHSPAVMEQWSSMANRHYDKLLASAESLDAAVADFLANTDSEHLTLAREAWTRAHGDFLSARVFFPGDTNDLTYRLDGWPLLEGFLDSLPAWPDSGIVNDHAIEISPTTLIAQHGITSHEEISLGFHALEYFLFARPLEDFVTGNGSESISRRREAISVITELLVLDAGQFTELGRERMATSQQNGASVDVAIKAIHNASERMLREIEALVSGEHTHSRFSETSWDNLGVQLVPIQQIVMEPGQLIDPLSALDKHDANNLQITIRQLSNMTETESMAEDPERTLLLLAALNHQFDRFAELVK